MIDPALPYAQVLAARADALATLCVHAGEAADEATGALEPPLVLASAFAFESADEAEGAFKGENDAYIYGRWGNPTVEALEAKLAALEGAEATCVAASGMTAITGALLAECEAGAHVVAPRSMYGESARLLRERLPRFGIRTTFIDDASPDGYARALEPSTRVLYVESPSNPLLAVTDVAAVAELARRKGITSIVDATFATPFALTPLALGADLVVHSMTKGLGGHGDAIGGCVSGARARVDRVRDLVVKGLGGVMSPLTAFLMTRGLRTFALRQRQACASAATLAERLAGHARVARVHHPSLPGHPGHATARAQMHAFGTLLAFELAAPGGARRVLEGVRVLTHAVSLGDARSLLAHPASTTHSTMPEADRARAGVTPALLRLSVGLESVDDLWRDLDTALSAPTTDA
jgi:methionine-gamma-lyase